MAHLRASLLAAAVAAPWLCSPAVAQVTTPASGVVCDGGGRVCYDSQGLSLALTQQYYGQLAAQAVLSQLGGGPAPTDFRLSSGAACSTAVRTCWSDGWGRRQVDLSLTQQLYGTSGAQANRPNRVEESDAGYCQLFRGGLRLYGGTCTLRKVSQNDRNRVRFDASLGNGSTYSFRQKDGNTTIQDASGGNWPVTASVQGRNVTFRWSDMQLVATRTGTSSSGATLGDALGIGIGNLLNSLFR